jgi:hypothetical protein
MTLTKINPNKYYSKHVPSSSGVGEYLVARWPSENNEVGDWKCTCSDFFFRSHDNPIHHCKHIRREVTAFTLAHLGR